VFVEENNDSFLDGKIAGDEDRNAGFAGFCA
jgi:hypothetical protein